MVILHSFLALAAGVAVLVLGVALLTTFIQRFLPSWDAAGNAIGLGAVFVHIAGCFAAAAAAGYVCSWISDPASIQHVLALGITVLVLTALSAVQFRGQRPVWFLVALVVAAPLGVLAGGLIWLRVTGILS